MKFLLTLVYLVFLLCASTAWAQRTSVQTDNFDDNNLSTGTVVWSQLNSVNAIMGNTGGEVLDNHTGEAVVRADGTYTDNQYSKLRISALASGDSSDTIGVVCRASADAGSGRDYYRMTTNFASPRSTVLARVSNGTPTTIASSTAITWAVNDTIEIECDASGAIRGLKSGTVILSGTDTNLTTGKPGISLSRQGHGDDWEGGDLTAVGVGFPTTGVIDTFTRGDGALGSDYTADIFGDASLMPQIATNVVAENAGAGDSNAYWDTATFGPDSEIYLTVTNIAFNSVKLYLRLANIGAGTLDGYVVSIDITTSPDLWTISRIDNGALTSLGTASLNIANGDSIGFSVYGSTIKIFHKPAAGAWTLVATVTDATYTATGYIAFYLVDNGTGNGRIDDLGGGGLIATKSSRAYRVIMQ